VITRHGALYARQIGLSQTDGILTGPELDVMGEAELAERLKPPASSPGRCRAKARAIAQSPQSQW